MNDLTTKIFITGRKRELVSKNITDIEKYRILRNFLFKLVTKNKLQELKDKYEKDYPVSLSKHKNDFWLLPCILDELFQFCETGWKVSMKKDGSVVVCEIDIKTDVWIVQV
jgi:hypothetical protein